MNTNAANSRLHVTQGNEHLGQIEGIVVVVVALILSLMTGVLSDAVAHAAPSNYSHFMSPCSTSSGHCYGIANWPNPILGSSTQFETVHLYSVNDGYDHISEEMWLLDTSHDCSGNGASWVEAGEGTWYGHTGNWYFWADCRPGSSFYSHFLYQPPSGDVDNFFPVPH